MHFFHKSGRNRKKASCPLIVKISETFANFLLWRNEQHKTNQMTKQVLGTLTNHREKSRKNPHCQIRHTCFHFFHTLSGPMVFLQANFQVLQQHTSTFTPNNYKPDRVEWVAGSIPGMRTTYNGSNNLIKQNERRTMHVLVRWQDFLLVVMDSLTDEGPRVISRCCKNWFLSQSTFNELVQLLLIILIDLAICHPLTPSLIPRNPQGKFNVISFMCRCVCSKRIICFVYKITEQQSLEQSNY